MKDGSEKGNVEKKEREWGAGRRESDKERNVESGGRSKRQRWCGGENHQGGGKAARETENLSKMLR